MFPDYLGFCGIYNFRLQIHNHMEVELARIGICFTKINMEHYCTEPTQSIQPKEFAMLDHAASVGYV